MRHHNTDTPTAELDGIGFIPGLVPDPLYDENCATIGPQESVSFWITVSTPRDFNPGINRLGVDFLVDGNRTATLSVALDVRPVTLEDTAGILVTHWFYADALCDWYNAEPYDERFWSIVKPYMRDLVEHGNNCQYVPIFTPPTDGVKRPHQLLKVTPCANGGYMFDFTDVSRWVQLARECGSTCFEWTHLFTQWGAQNAIRIYRSNDDPASLLWPADTPATSDIYRAFLAQFLPAFRAFLESEGLLEVSLFHISDEPHQAEHMANYRHARAMLKELAPWMKVCDAVSEIEYGREGLTDMPIVILNSARKYAEASIPASVYFCGGPRGSYVNRLMDTPLTKIRMTGWLLYALRAQGFLHWGYNYWYKSQTQELIDPFHEQSGAAWPGWAHGDPFVVYPGPDGPLDSIRWEVFAESLQDYKLLKTLEIDPDAELLHCIKGYDDFPKHADWLQHARADLLAK